MKNRKNILVCPLDWGIGHASRCVPIIKLLSERGLNVILGASGRPAAFLRSEFPMLEFIPVEGYNIRYPIHGSMAIQMMKQFPSLQKSIKKEHKLLDTLIDKYEINAVLSDNRFGMWSEKVHSIYMTHQVMIKAPQYLSFTESILYAMHRRYISKYDECWIPDIEENNGLSGDLAHKKKAGIPSYFIGPQSRFKESASTVHEKKYELMFIISGPEPQRSVFENMVLEQLSRSKHTALVVLGKPELKEPSRLEGNIEIHAHMNTEEMQRAMLSSDLIVCRPGYTSIMDLSALGRPAAFVSTPGQTEQQYLTLFHLHQGHYYSVSQKDFNITGLIAASKDYRGIKLSADNSILHDRIDQLFSQQA